MPINCREVEWNETLGMRRVAMGKRYWAYLSRTLSKWVICWGMFAIATAYMNGHALWSRRAALSLLIAVGSGVILRMFVEVTSHTWRLEPGRLTWAWGATQREWRLSPVALVGWHLIGDRLIRIEVEVIKRRGTKWRVIIGVPRHQLDEVLALLGTLGRRMNGG